MAKVDLKFVADVKDANKQIDGLKANAQSLEKSSILGKGKDALNGKGGSLFNANGLTQAAGELQGALGSLTSGADGITTAMGRLLPAIGAWGAAIGAVIAACKLLYDQMARDVQAGKPTADEHEALSAKLGVQLSQYGIDPEPIIKQFQIMAENGVASATHLADAFIKLVPTLKGNADGAVKLVARFADVEAATGITADSLTSLMGRIESTGEVDSKIIKQLEKKNIPIMRELASIYGTDAAGVNELAKAHEIGVEQMQDALMKTTEMYAGTAAALSATTEGSRASMEAAIGRAKESAAASANEVMKAYYNERQARMDMLAASAEYQAQMRAEGQIVGEVDVALLKLKDAWGDFLVDCIKWLDDIGMLGWFTGDDKTITERLDDRAVDKYDTITNSYKNIGDSKYYKRDEVEADLQGLQDAVAWMEKQGIAYDTDELAAVKGSMEALIAALTESEKAAQEQAKAAQEQAAASKEQAKAAKKAADEQAKASAAGKDIWARKLMQGNASADEVAKAFGFADAGFGNSALDQAMALFEELMGKARDGTITQKEIETLNRLQSLIDYIHQKQEKESETWQKAIKERAAENSKRQDIGNELRNAYGMTDEQRGIYDKLKGLVEKLNNSDLTNKEKHSILGKEIGKMVKGAIQGTVESIAAGNVSGLKDFKFTDYSGVQVDTLKEIQRQGKIAEKQLTTEQTIAGKLPSPIVAQ